MALADLKAQLLEMSRPVMLVGDGTDVCLKAFGDELPALCTAPDVLRFQQAVGVAFAAEGMIERGELCPSKELLPQYLRLPQAERELRAKNGLA